MHDVEKLFTECFMRGDRKKAMTFLRPMQPKDTHIVTFFLGINLCAGNEDGDTNKLFCSRLMRSL